jgi:hypothetical protein
MKIMKFGILMFSGCSVYVWFRAKNSRLDIARLVAARFSICKAHRVFPTFLPFLAAVEVGGIIMQPTFFKGISIRYRRGIFRQILH